MRPGIVVKERQATQAGQPRQLGAPGWRHAEHQLPAEEQCQHEVAAGLGRAALRAF